MKPYNDRYAENKIIITAYDTEMGKMEIVIDEKNRTIVERKAKKGRVKK